MHRVFLLAALLFPGLAPLGATSYFLDSQNGNDSNSGLSPELAWKSLQPVNSQVFQPGDEILFRAGTVYAGQLKPQGSGNLAEGTPNPVVIDMYGAGAKPRIDGEGKYLETVFLHNIECWEINNLEITNLGPTPGPNRKGVYLHLDNFGTAHHLVLRNLYIHDVNGSNVKQEGGGHGILWYVEGNTRKSRYDGLLIEECHLVRCDRNGIIGGGYWSRAEWFPNLNVVIRKNLLEDIGGDGIVPIACDGALVEWNVLRDSGKRTPPGDAAAGIWPWSCDNTLVQFNEVSGQRGYWDAQGFDSDWNCQNTIIQYNYSHDNEGGFLLICNDGSSGPTYNVGNLGTVVRYNISVNDGYRATGSAAGFSPTFHIAGPCRNTFIYNNTIYVGKKAAASIDTTLVEMGNWNGWSSDTYFYNNIFFAEDTVRNHYGQALNTIFENNLYWGSHQNAPADLKALQLDPLFINPGHSGDGFFAPLAYRLQELSPCIGASKPIANNGGRDFSRLSLPVDRPASLGALEFTDRSNWQKPANSESDSRQHLRE
jgi:hypothetical protein